MRFLIFLLCIFITPSCNPNSLEEYQEEGNEIVEKLIGEFQSIQNRQQLVEASPRLTHLFDELADLMMEADRFRKLHPELDPVDPTPNSLLLSRSLREEMERVYQIEGARELVERCQEKALFQLGK